MTGRELIVYILENGLEDEPVFKDDKFVGFITVAEAAGKMDVGTATIEAWAALGMLDSINVVEGVYISESILRTDSDE